MVALKVLKIDGFMNANSSRCGVSKDSVLALFLDLT